MNKEFVQKCQFRYKRHSSLNILVAHNSSHNGINSFMIENSLFCKRFLWKKDMLWVFCSKHNHSSQQEYRIYMIDSSEIICPRSVSFLSCWQCHHHPKRTPTLLWVCECAICISSLNWDSFAQCASVLCCIWISVSNVTFFASIWV